ncbi:MAG: BamA/TamA family outer membrane protein [Cyanobacteria bacterium P01_C01_bin.72]
MLLYLTSHHQPFFIFSVITFSSFIYLSPQAVAQAKVDINSQNSNSLDLAEVKRKSYFLDSDFPDISPDELNKYLEPFFMLAQKPSQDEDKMHVPTGDSETITEIVVRFVDQDGNPVEGKTKPNIIKQEFALKPGDVYRADLAQVGLERVLYLNIVEDASLSLEQVVDSKQAVMAISVQEKGQLAIAFGLTLPPPTALQGVVKPTTVNALSDAADGFSAAVQFGLRNLGGTNQEASLGIEGGASAFGFNLGYRKFIRSDRGFGANFYNQRGVEAEFDDGDPNLNLDNGADPWVHRFGGGVEYFTPLAQDWQSAIGVSYQQVTIRDGAFTANLEATDEAGNRLTVNDSGRDEFLTLNFATVLNRQDNPAFPTRGYKLLFGSDQYFSLAGRDILANRLAANYTHYFPVPLFGFTDGAKTLIFNLQGGTILGDALPYDSFILGGSSIVRGYDDSEISTSRSFVQTSLEYRFPLYNLSAFNQDLPINGALFIDYASDLGSADAVIGQPAVVRNRPGDGLGYGLGIQTRSPIGLIRTEFALNDQGDSEFIFSVGDRF